MEENISNIVEEKIPWVEASGRRSNLVEIKLPKIFSAIYPEIILPKTFSALYLWKSNLSTTLPAIMLMKIMK